MSMTPQNDKPSSDKDLLRKERLQETYVIRTYNGKKILRKRSYSFQIDESMSTLL